MFGALRQPVPYLGGNLLLNKEPAFFYHLAWDYMVFKGGEGGGERGISRLQYGIEK